MPVYYYKASTREGAVIEGILNSSDDKMAAEKLKDSGLILLSISESKKESKQSIFSPSLHNHLLSFTTELAALLNAGLPLDRSLVILSETSTNNAMRDVITSLTRSINEGKSLSEALQKHGNLFSRLYVNVVRAGESGGVLELVLDKLGEFLESTKEMKESIYSAMIYPAFLTLMGGASIIVLLTYVIPKFTTIFEDLDQTLPLSTQILISISNMLIGYWWIFLIITGLFFYSFKKFISNESGKLKWDSFKLKVMGNIVIKLETARICRTLGTLSKSGVPLLQALGNVREIVGNSVIRNSIDGIIKGVKEGRGLSEPIIETGLFPPLALSMIKVGEETGRIEEMLLKIADTYEKSLNVTIKRFVNLLEPLMILTMGVVVGLIVMSMLLAIFSINEIPM